MIDTSPTCEAVTCRKCWFWHRTDTTDKERGGCVLHDEAKDASASCEQWEPRDGDHETITVIEIDGSVTTLGFKTIDA